MRHLASFAACTVSTGEVISTSFSSPGTNKGRTWLTSVKGIEAKAPYLMEQWGPATSFLTGYRRGSQLSAWDKLHSGRGLRQIAALSLSHRKLLSVLQSSWIRSVRKHHPCVNKTHISKAGAKKVFKMRLWGMETKQVLTISSCLSPRHGSYYHDTWCVQSHFSPSVLWTECRKKHSYFQRSPLTRIKIVWIQKCNSETQNAKTSNQKASQNN